MYTYTIYPVADGFGYLVEADDGTFRVKQDYMPVVEGAVQMDEADATARAEALIAERLAQAAS